MDELFKELLKEKNDFVLEYKKAKTPLRKLRIMQVYYGKFRYILEEAKVL